MNNLNLKNIAENLIETFLKAGEIAKEISSRGVKITIKSDKSPVTDGDLAVDKHLKNKIESLSLGISIVSEETVNLKTKIEEITSSESVIPQEDNPSINNGASWSEKNSRKFFTALLKEEFFIETRYRLGPEVLTDN